MDPAYISAVAALSGSIIGGLTSLGASWVSHNAQARTQLLLESKSRRQELYRAFIEEASRLYGDALVTDSADNADVSKLVGLYAMLGRMRILSSPAVVGKAEEIIEVIAKEYFAPSRTLHQMFTKGPELDMKEHELDIIRHFSEACRADLRERGSI